MTLSETSRDHSQYTRLPKRNLDILRSIAVICVLADHTMGSWNRSLSLLLSNWTLGRMGVLFFFVHTALVLMSSLERQGTVRPHWIRYFYVRRAFRIYPLAIASVAIYVVFSLPSSISILGVSGPAAPLNAVTLAANFTLTQNLTGSPNIVGQLWSLPLEVQMYLLLPLCFLVARRGALAMAGLIGALVLMGLIVHSSGIRGIWRLSMFEFGPCFAGECSHTDWRAVGYAGARRHGCGHWQSSLPAPCSLHPMRRLPSRTADGFPVSFSARAFRSSATPPSRSSRVQHTGSATSATVSTCSTSWCCGLLSSRCAEHRCSWNGRRTQHS